MASFHSPVKGRLKQWSKVDLFLGLTEAKCSVYRRMRIIMAFPLLAGTSGGRANDSFPASTFFFFEVEISLHTSVLLFKP